jgi:hypothetical protein
VRGRPRRLGPSPDNIRAICDEYARADAAYEAMDPDRSKVGIREFTDVCRRLEIATSAMEAIRDTASLQGRRAAEDDLAKAEDDLAAVESALRATAAAMTDDDRAKFADAVTRVGAARVRVTDTIHRLAGARARARMPVRRRYGHGHCRAHRSNGTTRRPATRSTGDPDGPAPRRRASTAGGAR